MSVARGPLVAIAGGGTGGHVNPALAIGEALRARGAEVVFIGTAHGLEARLVPARGHRLELVPGSRLVGAGALGRLRGLWALGRGVLAARRLLRREGVALVLGVGGYASGAAVLAAWTLGLPTAIHESNAAPGLTNRMLGRLVRRVYLGFPQAAWPFRPARVQVVGNPVRPEIVALPERSGAPADGVRRVLVVGGSQGARFLNERVPALLARLAQAGPALQVRHQVGKLAAEPVVSAYQQAGLDAEVLPYIDDMAAALAWADLVVGRSGSGTLAELAAAGVPALLVPFPFAADDHQAANARAFCRPGAGVWWRQEEWDEQKLAAAIAPLLTDMQVWQRASAAARAQARGDAADAVARDCLRQLGREA